MQGFGFHIDYCVHISDINYGGHVANSAVLNFFRMRASHISNILAVSARWILGAAV